MKLSTFKATGGRMFPSAREEWRAARQAARRGLAFREWNLSWYRVESTRLPSRFWDPLARRATLVAREGRLPPLEYRGALGVRRYYAEHPEERRLHKPRLP